MNQPRPPASPAHRPAHPAGCHPAHATLFRPSAFSTRRPASPNRLSASQYHRPAASPDRHPACLDRLMPCPSPSPHLARPLPTRLTGLPRLPVALPGHRFACVTHPLRPPQPALPNLIWLSSCLTRPSPCLSNPSPHTPLMIVALPTLPSRLLACCLCPA